MFEAMPRALAGRCTRKFAFVEWEAGIDACQTMMDPDYYRYNGTTCMCVYRCEVCGRLHTSKVVHKFDDENYRVVHYDPTYRGSELAINYSRFKSIMTGMTSAAKKVYDAVPMTEQWTTAQVLAELTRLGVHMDYRVVGGCLDCLVKSRLVKEAGKDAFQREPVRGLVEREARIEEVVAVDSEVTVEQPQQDSIMQKIMDATPDTLNPLDRLGVLANRVGTMAGDLQQLASDISDAAVDIQAQIDANETNVAKLRQLQQLLKSLELTS